MSLNSSLFTSISQVWETPQNLFDKLNSIFNFNYDLAADVENRKCNNFFSKEDSALDSSWKGIVGYCNPPFADQDRFIKKACQELVENDSTSVFLIPVRTDTKRWQEYIFPYAKHIIFLKGRLKFSGHENSAPFPSAIVVFTRNHYNLTELNDLGYEILT